MTATMGVMDMAAQQGGKREGAGRPKGSTTAPPAKMISIRLAEAEIEELDTLIERLGPDANRSTIIRFVLANQWLLTLTPAQLATLRSKAGIAGHGD